MPNRYEMEAFVKAIQCSLIHRNVGCRMVGADEMKTILAVVNYSFIHAVGMAGAGMMKHSSTR